MRAPPHTRPWQRLYSAAAESWWYLQEDVLVVENQYNFRFPVKLTSIPVEGNKGSIWLVVTSYNSHG